MGWEGGGAVVDSFLFVYVLINRWRRSKNLLSQFAKKTAREAHVSDVTNHTLHNKQVSWCWSEFSLWGPPTLIFHIMQQYLSPEFCGSCKHPVRLLCGNRFSLTGSAFFPYFFFFYEQSNTTFGTRLHADIMYCFIFQLAPFRVFTPFALHCGPDTAPVEEPHDSITPSRRKRAWGVSFP